MQSGNQKFVHRAALLSLCFFFMASASFAATKPINNPNGLALDSKGNLYIANTGGNDILVYNPSYFQLTAKTISSNIIQPTAVAFDPQGNLWVANYGNSNGGPNGSVAEYTNGVQNTNNTITNGIFTPIQLAIDEIGNIWVQNNYTTVTVYGPFWAYAANVLLKTFTPQYPVYGLAVKKGIFAYGGSTQDTFAGESQALTSGNILGHYNPNDTGLALAIDAKGNVYQADLNGVVDIEYPGALDGYFLTLPFTSTGIAVDDARGRIYFSNSSGNSISVYSLSGTLLHVIQ